MKIVVSVSVSVSVSSVVSGVGGSPPVCSETRSGLSSGHRGCSRHDWQHNQSSRGSGHLSVKKTVTTHQHLTHTSVNSCVLRDLLSDVTS